MIPSLPSQFILRGLSVSEKNGKSINVMQHRKLWG
jgi:hypothetical protein